MAPPALLNVGTVIVTYLILSTSLCVYLKSAAAAAASDATSTVNPTTTTLLFFNNLNTFIAICEISLGLHIRKIKSDFIGLKKKYGSGKEWDGCCSFLTMRLSGMREVVDLRTWSWMWSTYALCEFYLYFKNCGSYSLSSLLILGGVWIGRASGKGQ